MFLNSLPVVGTEIFFSGQDPLYAKREEIQKCYTKITKISVKFFKVFTIVDDYVVYCLCKFQETICKFRFLAIF
jgi:hypothetical protein